MSEEDETTRKCWQYLEYALLSVVIVVVLLLMLLPTIFYNLPLPVRNLRFTLVYMYSINGQFPSWYNSRWVFSRPSLSSSLEL